MEDRVYLDKKAIDSIILINKHCKEIVDYIKILQTVTGEKDIFEKTFSRIEGHFNELKKVKLELKYKK